LRCHGRRTRASPADTCARVGARRVGVGCRERRRTGPSGREPHGGGAEEGVVHNSLSVPHSHVKCGAGLTLSQERCRRRIQHRTSTSSNGRDPCLATTARSLRLAFAVACGRARGGRPRRGRCTSPGGFASGPKGGGEMCGVVTAADIPTSIGVCGRCARRAPPRRASEFWQGVRDRQRQARVRRSGVQLPLASAVLTQL
jgi:hypothetical protein